MAKPREPQKLTQLKGCKVMRHKSKKEGRDVALKVEDAMAPLDGSRGMAGISGLSTADDWYRRIAGTMQAIGILRKIDEPVLMAVCESLCRYGKLEARLAKCKDDVDEEVKLHGMLHRELGVFIRLSDRIGLNPATRSKFLVEAGIVKKLAEGPERKFDWDGKEFIDAKFEEVKKDNGEEAATGE